MLPSLANALGLMVSMLSNPPLTSHDMVLALWWILPTL
jgi:hypothetical protein